MLTGKNEIILKIYGVILKMMCFLKSSFDQNSIIINFNDNFKSYISQK